MEKPPNNLLSFPKPQPLTSPDPSTQAITKSQHHALSFFDIGGMGEAEISSEFDQHEFVERIIQDMRDPDARVRATARRFFWSLKKDLATMAGYIGKASQKREVDQDGNVISQKTTLSAQVLVHRMKGMNPHDHASDPTSSSHPSGTVLAPARLDIIEDREIEAPTPGGGSGIQVDSDLRDPPDNPQSSDGDSGLAG